MSFLLPNNILIVLQILKEQQASVTAFSTLSPHAVTTAYDCAAVSRNYVPRAA